MKLSNDFDERSGGLPMAYMSVIVFLFLITVFGIVLLLNHKPSSAAKKGQETVQTAAEAETETETGGSELGLAASGDYRRAEDLDFWDMYPEEEEPEEEPVVESRAEENEEEEEVPIGPENDGKHTLIIGENGQEEWISINPALKRNSYDYEGLVYQYPIMKYFENSQQVSRLGVDISKYNGDVDFRKLKKAGVNFVETVHCTEREFLV